MKFNFLKRLLKTKKSVKPNPKIKTESDNRINSKKLSQEQTLNQDILLTTNQVKIIDGYFLNNTSTININTNFLHGGYVDFSYCPLSEMPIWLAPCQPSSTPFPYGQSSGRKYQTIFKILTPLKLLEFTIDNTAPLASILKCDSRGLDKLLALYLNEKQVDGLLGPTGNVMLNDPRGLLIATNHDGDKSGEFESFKKCILSNNKKVLSKEKLREHTIVNGANHKYEVKFEMNVLRFKGKVSDYYNLKYISSEEVMYHLARTLDLNTAIYENNYLVEASYFNRLCFLEKI